MERTYDKMLGTEEMNAYAIEFLLNVTNYIMGKRPPLSSMSLSELLSSLPNSSSRSLLSLALDMLINHTKYVLIKGATLPEENPLSLVYDNYDDVNDDNGHTDGDEGDDHDHDGREED